MLAGGMASLMPRTLLSESQETEVLFGSGKPLVSGCDARPLRPQQREKKTMESFPRAELTERLNHCSRTP
jgi:hypothetical protein